MVLLIDEMAIHRRDVGILRVTGPDRLTYLHSLLSQDLESATAGTAADFMYLDAKGTAIAAGRAVVTAEAVLLVVPSEVATTFADALRRFTFLLQATTEDLSGSWAMASVRAPSGVDVPGARAEPMTAGPARDGFAIRDRSGGVDYLGPQAWVDDVSAQTGLPVAGASEWEAWRISAGEPGWGTEITAGRRAQELGLLPTHVHLRKGCYPGQESIAKIYNLGRPRRSLAVAEFTGRVSPGDTVEVGGKAGEITSAAAARDVWVALVLVPVDRDGTLTGDGTLRVGDVNGHVRHRVGAELAIPGA